MLNYLKEHDTLHELFMQIKKSKSTIELKKMLNSGKWNDTEELVDYYASKAAESKISMNEVVEVRVKERNQPYMENMVTISQFVESQQSR